MGMKYRNTSKQMNRYLPSILILDDLILKGDTEPLSAHFKSQ